MRLPDSSCHSLLKNGATEDGEYKVKINGVIKTVYCDMKTLGGGWTILQRRGDFGRNKNYFLRNWNDYKNGFGDPVEDVWLGLEAAHHLTKESEFQLMVVLQDFDNNSTSLIVNNFTIGPEEEGYKISYKNYNSKIGNSLPARGTKFSTIDTDNDSLRRVEQELRQALLRRLVVQRVPQLQPQRALPARAARELRQRRELVPLEGLQLLAQVLRDEDPPLRRHQRRKQRRQEQPGRNDDRCAGVGGSVARNDSGDSGYGSGSGDKR